MTDEQIKYMVDRFLNWKLPENFNPDGGISFERFGSMGTEHQYRRVPSGTNLIDAIQADAMVRYMIDGIPSNPKDADEIERLRAIIDQLRTVAGAVSLEIGLTFSNIKEQSKNGTSI